MADPVLPVAPVTLADLTEAKLDGAGVFDTLMRASGLHVQQEFDRNRIKGQDYAQVYLTAMQYTLQNSVAFLLAKDKSAYDAALVEANIRLVETQIKLAEKQLEQEALRADLLVAQAALTRKQADQITAELLNIPKQGMLIDAQVSNATKQGLLTDAQVAQTTAETLNVPKQGALLDAQKTMVTNQSATELKQALLVTAQTTTATNQAANIAAETLNVPKQGLLIDAQSAKTAAETTNLAQELLNMKAQECLLTAQYDLTMVQKLQTTAQTSLVQQKIATEKAQTVETGTDANSVIGRQKDLYKAQTEGFSRDAEQKAAKALIDTWNVRRTTDEGTVADTTNMLNDATIGRVVTKMLAGVNA